MVTRLAVPRPVLLLAVSLAATGSNVSGQVLNMSHDLVSLGIASQNLVPNMPSQDARPLIQAAVQYVQSHPVQVLTLDKGDYYLLTATQSNATLLLFGLANLTVDLAGSTIYFNGPLLPNGIFAFGLSNFTLTNFQTDFVNPPYTHVQLTSVDPCKEPSPTRRFRGGETLRSSTICSQPKVSGQCSFAMALLSPGQRAPC